MSSNTYDAVVIGAGVIGTAVAYELARRGRRTLSLDKGPGPGHGPTSASCAIVRFSYSTLAGVAMSYEGLRYWENWADYLGSSEREPIDETGLITYNACGTVLLKTERGGHHEKVLPLLRQLGIPHEDWTTDELLARMPSFSPGAFGPPKRPDDHAFWDEPTTQIAGGVFTPESGYVSDPAHAAHNLMRAAEAHGGTFRFNTEVIAIDRTIGTDGRHRTTGVTLASGTTVAAPVVVNVAGPHSAIVNRMAGVDGTMKITTRPLRHEVHHVPMGDIPYDNGWHVQDGDLGIYFRPEVGRNILIGSEDPECDPREWVDPDDFHPSVTDAQWDAQVLRMARRIPALGVPHQKKGVVGLYDVSDDWIPIYDRTDLDGFYVAIGTSGNQFKNAGVAGHCMAELIDAVEAGHDHDTDPLVVTGRYTGLPLDLGAYGRNREVNMNSSFSVNG